MEPVDTQQGQRLGILNLRFSDVLLTLLIPAALYALVFTYEDGYYQYFFLPTAFIQLDPNAILNGLVDLGWILLGNFTAWFVVVTSFAMLLDVTEEEFFRLRFMLYVLLTNILFAIRAVSVQGFIALNFFWLGVIIAVLVRWRKKKVVHPAPPANMYSSVFDALAFVLGKRNYVIALILASSLFFVYDAGWERAAGEGDFLVTATQPHQAVLASTDSLFITAPYAAMSESRCSGAKACFGYRPEYTFSKIPDQGQLTLLRKNLGPLLVMRASPPAQSGVAAWFSSWFLRQRK